MRFYSCVILCKSSLARSPDFRGLKAFVKYVPRDVVRMMLVGEMESTNVMTRRVVSMLFMDIAGFSTLCEDILADQLVRLTDDYLQAMCEIIVNSNGTLDKARFVLPPPPPSPPFSLSVVSSGVSGFPWCQIAP